MYEIKLDFLLLIHFMSISFLDQIEELRRVEESFFFSLTIFRSYFLLCQKVPSRRKERKQRIVGRQQLPAGIRVLCRNHAQDNLAVRNPELSEPEQRHKGPCTWRAWGCWASPSHLCSLTPLREWVLQNRQEEHLESYLIHFLLPRCLASGKLSNLWWK